MNLNFDVLGVNILDYSFNGVNVAVIGLGISNTPLIGWLLERGAVITARDKKPFDKLNETVRSYKDRGVRFICGEDYLEDLNESVIFKAPGLRYDVPQIKKAVEAGAVLTSEMELFFELCPCRIIGVTGSDGKTTSTTLIYKALSSVCGDDKVFVGGNIGKPLLPELDKMTKDGFAVLELSSFQLHTMKLSPDISLITNISPNHLDYHKGMDEYIDAKKNIYLHAKLGSRLVLNGKNEITSKLGADAPLGVEISRFVQGDVEVCDGYICRRGEKVLKTSDILIPGKHNVENFMGVIAVLDGLVPDDAIVSLAKTFKGVEHRIEFVREFDHVKYYNSSIDSSPTRTAAALNSFDQKLIVICGGYDKHIPFEPLAVSLCTRAKAVVLTGATAGRIKKVLLASELYKPGSPEIIEMPDFADAVEAAKKAAVPGDIVILSPACASFDRFSNFEERGNTYKDIVNKWT